MEKDISKLQDEKELDKPMDAEYKCIQEESDGDYNNEQNNRTTFRVCVWLIVIVMMLTAILFQQGRLAELKEKQANSTAVLIIIREETLLIKYGIIPSEVDTLCESRAAWINNPCNQTAEQYCELLEVMLDVLEEEFEDGPVWPPESNDTPVTV